MLETNFTPFPILETQRLQLRETAHTDVNELFYMRSNEDVMRYIDRPRPASTDDIVQLIDKIHNMAAIGDGISWAINLKGDPTFIGTISFHRLIKENYRAEIGYMLHPAHHGKAIMDEAIRAAVDFGFNTIGLHSIEAHVNPENIASRKLLERNGFVQEAYFKENHYWQGKFWDTVIYSRVLGK
jgi:ribosomal-protein-alanine N-acetyltransferase